MRAKMIEALQAHAKGHIEKHKAMSGKVFGIILLENYVRSMIR